jgi:hypothetical protein
VSPWADAVGLNPSTRDALDRHLRQADFELRVATNFACLADTPALEGLRAALGKVGEARALVKTLAVEHPVLRPKSLPVGQGLPVTRRERHGYRWL